MTIMFFIMGLCVGSFVNMLTYRTAVRYGLIKPITKKQGTNNNQLPNINKPNKNRSFCDYCGRQLRWYENVPVVSWIVQKGKTRCCKKKLPIEYPLIETGTAILFGITYYVLSSTYKTELEIGLGLVVVTMLVFETVFDGKYMILPDFATYILIGISLLQWQNWRSGLGAFIFLLILHVVTKGKGMGIGDVKLAIFMGLFLGWPGILMAFYIAFISGAIVGVGLILTKKLKRTSQIPFGPFLIGGTMLAYLYGGNLLYYVSRWF
jgi:leader peptidase (prepilin peptidase)/N-methyltransferase